MSVRIRLKRMGKRNFPFFRIDAFDARAPRDGKSLETLGHYNPLEKDEAKKVSIKKERLDHWISKGAEVSEAVAALLKKRGMLATRKKSRKKAPKKVE